MTGLPEWVTEVCHALGLDPATDGGDTALVLDVARDVAHGVLRPGAPVAAYLLGIAVGRGADPATAAAAITALAGDWPPAADQDG